MGVFIVNALSAQYVEWQNYTSGSEVKCTAFDGTYVWAGTPYSGLMRVEVSTQEVVFFDNTNSGLPLNNVDEVAVAIKKLLSLPQRSLAEGTEFQ